MTYRPLLLDARARPETPFALKLASGAVAGIFGTTIIYPIDFVKTRLQSQASNGQGAWACARSVVRAVGLTGLYRGLLPNLIGVTPEKAIKLAVNDYVRAQLARATHTSTEALSVSYGMIAGATAGFCQVLATNPMEIVKIQMQMASETRRSLTAVVRQLGLRGLYYGASATLLRDVPFSVIFFTMSAGLRRLATPVDAPHAPLGAVFGSGLTAAVAAGVLATPMDVVKTRLQSAIGHGVRLGHPPVLATYAAIWRTEGIRAFFRGAPQRCMTIAPLFGISLLVYEVQQRLWLADRSSY